MFFSFLWLRQVIWIEVPFELTMLRLFSVATARLLMPQLHFFRGRRKSFFAQDAENRKAYDIRVCFGRRFLECVSVCVLDLSRRGT